MIKVFFAILVLSWGAGIYFRSDSREKPKARVTSLDAADAVTAEDRQATESAAAPETTTPEATPTAQAVQASGEAPVTTPAPAIAPAETAAPSAAANELEQAAKALVTASEATPSPSPSESPARAPASIRGDGATNTFRPPGFKAVEYLPLEEALKGGADPRWQIVEAGNDQAVRLFRGVTPFIDRSPYHFVPPIADLDQACPPLAAMKISAVLRFDLEGKLAEIVAADDKMAAIAKDVFTCQIAPRQLRGEAIPFKTLFVPRASR